MDRDKKLKSWKRSVIDGVVNTIIVKAVVNIEDYIEMIEIELASGLT